VSTPRPPLIGLSPRLLRNPPAEIGFHGKTLQYLEQSVASWVMAHEAIAVMVPSVLRDSLDERAVPSARRFAQRLDGLVLQGGADIHPSLYGDAPRYPEAVTDVVRDRFELELLRAFLAEGKPVLGICRGMQLINVSCGGTLHQDLLDAGAARDAHVLAGSGEAYRHAITLVGGGWLQRLHGGLGEAQVNSIHHQGVDRLGAGLVVEAVSHDGVVEAIRGTGPGFLVGLQWHPEFHDQRFPEFLSPGPVMEAFLDQARSIAQAGPGPANCGSGREGPKRRENHNPQITDNPRQGP
jgi:gamma-glutamyl-gamma-aminobutyrate hydrolase PuuD